MHGALIAGVPLLVISGESTTYGEQPDFDPVIPHAPFLDVYDTRNYEIPPQALDYLLHGRG